jgi:hypothetical protein
MKLWRRPPCWLLLESDDSSLFGPAQRDARFLSRERSQCWLAALRPDEGGYPTIRARSIQTRKSETAERSRRTGGIAAPDASYRYLKDYFSNTATKGSLGRVPKMVRTLHPVPRTS